MIFYINQSILNIIKILIVSGEFILSHLTLPFIVFLILYIFFILSFFLYVFKNKKQLNNLNISYISLIKNKDFIIFKNNLFQLYYISTIILIVFLLKNNYFTLLFNFNLFFIIIMTYTILLNNKFILSLFNIYKEILKIINILNNINFVTPLIYTLKNKNVNFNLYTQTRAFSTDSESSLKSQIIYKNDMELYIESLEKDNYKGIESNFVYKPELDNMIYSEWVNKISDSIFLRKYLDYKIAKDIHEFRLNYLDGGIIGFANIKLIDEISQYVGLTLNFECNEKLNEIKTNLQNQIINYLKDLPAVRPYSVLPILRWDIETGNCKSLSLTESFKIGEYTDFNLIAKDIVKEIFNYLENFKNDQFYDSEIDKKFKFFIIK